MFYKQYFVNYFWQFIAPCLLCLIFLTGCASTNCCVSIKQDRGESIRYFVFGFGMLTVPKTNKEVAVTATKLDALGVSLSDQPGLKLGIGYSSSTVVLVPNGAEDVRVEIGSCAGDGMTVDTQRAKLSDSFVNISKEVSYEDKTKN